jgi:hypothetical protein
MEGAMRPTKTAASAVLILAVLFATAVAQEGERKQKSPELKGTVLSIDAEGGKISVRRGGDGAWDCSLKIGGDAAVLIDGREGKLSEIPAGAVVTCRLSSDETEVLAVRAEGRTAKLTVWAVDVVGRTITLAGGDEGERTWPLADGVSVAEIRGGQRAAVRFSVDGKRVVGVAAGQGGKEGREGGKGARVKGDGNREDGARDEVKRRPEGEREGERKPETKRKPEGDREGERKEETKRKPEGDREGERKEDVKRKPEGDREGERKPETKRKPEGGREGERKPETKKKPEGDREGERKKEGDRKQEGEDRGKEEGKGDREEEKDER